MRAQGRQGLLLFALMTSMVAVGCSKNDSAESGVSGQAKVVMGNTTISSVGGAEKTSHIKPLANSCPASNTCAAVDEIEKFEIKMMSVGIHTHEDTTQGYGSAIFMNAACPAPEYETEVDGKMYKYIGFGSCSDSSITTYLDLKSATVNADLNSQYLPIAPGVYKYGSLGFCQGGASSDNYRITFGNGGSLPNDLKGQTVNISVGTCGVTTPEMSPAMTVAEGDSVIVTLGYDLANTVYYRTLGGGESAGTACAEVNNGTRYAVCINAPTIGASFTVE